MININAFKKINNIFDVIYIFIININVINACDEML